MSDLFLRRVSAANRVVLASLLAATGLLKAIQSPSEGIRIGTTLYYSLIVAEFAGAGLLWSRLGRIVGWVTVAAAVAGWAYLETSGGWSTCGCFGALKVSIAWHKLLLGTLGMCGVIASIPLASRR